jgi:hypothetical protein
MSRVQERSSVAYKEGSSRVTCANWFNLAVGSVFALAAIGSAYLARSPKPARGPLLAEPEILDLGTARQGETIDGAFTLSNQGPKPIDIVHVAKSCGCTDAQVVKPHLEPGEATPLYVAIKTGTVRDALSVRLVIVYQPQEEGPSSASRQQRVDLVAWSQISPDVDYEPRLHQFRLGTPSSQHLHFKSNWLAGQLVRRCSASHRAFEIKQLSDPNEVEVRFDPTLWRAGDHAATDLVFETSSKVTPFLRIPVEVASDSLDK